MADVRKGAGLTVRGFYAHFLSKEMLAVIGEVSTTARGHAPVLAEQIETVASELSPHLSSGASAAAGVSRRSSNACERPSTRRAR